MAEPRVERRLAAILAADVAGYSRLMGADETGTAQALREHRAVVNPIVADHGGRIVKTTGDGVLSEFPSIVAAVECALAVQKLMAERNADVPESRQMLFRIGINLGDVLIEGEDILGDGVNVAARLEGISEPGGICISDAAYQQVRDKLDVKFEDIGEQQLKNIARRVRAYRARLDGAVRLKPTLPLPEKPSIAVLPFDNMSDAAGDVYFADGMAEDIITELSRYPDLFVIARNSSFTYRGKAVRITEVARELGVQYVLEGSVRRAGNRVRISVQLIDAASGGKHVWAQRYDRSLEDIFAVQDEVTQNVVSVLPARVRAAALERASRKTSDSLDAYDHLLRGKYYHHLESPNGNREAEVHFNQSIELDPRFASAYAWKACTLGQAWGSEFRPRTPELRQEIDRYVEMAARLDANEPSLTASCAALPCYGVNSLKASTTWSERWRSIPTTHVLSCNAGSIRRSVAIPRRPYRGSSGRCGSIRFPRIVTISIWRAHCSWHNVLARRLPCWTKTVATIGSTTCGSRLLTRLLRKERWRIKPGSRPSPCGLSCRSRPTSDMGSPGSGPKIKTAYATR